MSTPDDRFRAFMAARDAMYAAQTVLNDAIDAGRPGWVVDDAALALATAEVVYRDTSATYLAGDAA